MNSATYDSPKPLEPRSETEPPDAAERPATDRRRDDVEHRSGEEAIDGDYGFFETLLRDDDRLDEMVIDSAERSSTVRKFLLVAVLGLVAHGLVVGLVSEAALAPETTAGIFNWYVVGTPAVSVPAALVGAFLTATAVGLPSFYFYARLAGADVSFAVVTGQSVRALARTSVALLALLPFYAALVLSSHLGVQVGSGVIVWGLSVPFFAGLVGIWSVFSSFRRLLDESDGGESMRMVRESRRDGLLGMVIGWGVLFTVVAPVAMWRYGAFLARLTL